MSNDPSPVKYRGTQSQETLAMEAALEHHAATVGSKIGDAADWAVGKAQDGLRSAGEHVRARATTAAAAYTREDPLRAVLIAAGAGALLMGVVALMARSGVRSVKRRVRR